MTSKILIGLLLGIISSMTLESRTWAGEGDFVAAAETAEEISLWLHKFKTPPKSIGIFSIKLPASLDVGFSNVIEAELVKYIQANSEIRVVNCPECRTPQLKVKGDRVIITKGTPNQSTLIDLAKSLEVETFLIVEVHKTRLSMLTHTTIYEVGSGQILGSETFRVPDIDFTESAVHYTLSVGPTLFLAKPKTNSTSTPQALGIDFSLLEELNFGKGGINIGGILNAEENNYYYLMPTIGLRSRLGRSSLHSLTTFGAGFGLGSAGKGAALGVGFHLYLGSFTFVGIRTNGFIPISQQESKGFLGSATLEIGLALGR